MKVAPPQKLLTPMTLLILLPMTSLIAQLTLLTLLIQWHICLYILLHCDAAQLEKSRQTVTLSTADHFLNIFLLKQSDSFCLFWLPCP